MPDVYSNIQLSETEAKGLSEVEDNQPSTLSDSTPEPTKSYVVNDGDREESKPQESSAIDNSEEQYEFQIGEETFGLDSVLEWKKDSDNKGSWNKTNTQKAQAIAQGGRLLELLDNDESFKDHVKEYFYEDDKEIQKYGLDGEFGIDFSEKVIEEEPELSEVQDYEEEDSQYDDLFERIDALEDEKLGRSLTDRYDSVRDANPNFFQSETDGVDFLNYCNENGVIENNDIDMEKTFKLWSYDRVMTAENRKEQLYQNKMRNEGSTIGNSEIGAREIRSGEKPKNYKEISMDNPDVSRYFNT